MMYLCSWRLSARTLNSAVELLFLRHSIGRLPLMPGPVLTEALSNYDEELRQRLIG